ncbi:peptide ABC transporter permease [Puniceibacterium antarcticum]|uniref:Peptide ABC transporter permease n=1 Tax=Puniceibacterium antarcticum TaxID=1206336 RepID=A0A2G8RED7_9RHOB|nr:ABC transporter permease [Puniceibacterium antarcticum]PIL19956.1 peptide ABC transporter permease [Puniceibacterium antarcticum]
MIPKLKSFGSMLSSVLVTLLGLAIVTFMIGRVMPVDPVLAAVGDNAPESVVLQARADMGLDDPLIVQFWHYLVQLAHGDFGRSVLTHNEVASDIAHYFPATMELATVALILAAVIGVPLGIWAAVRQGSITDQVIRVLCLTGHSVPVFVLALVGLLIFYVFLDIVPGPGRQDIIYEGMIPSVTGFLTIDTILAGDAGAFWDAVHHMALPVCILSYFSMAYITRMTRAFMLGALKGEYIVAARAKGLSLWAVVLGHAFPNVAVQLITVLALTYAGLLEGAVVTETVFAWPGLGQYLTNSLMNGDMNPVVGTTLLIGCVYVGLNLLADLLYRVFDPRVK